MIILYIVIVSVKQYRVFKRFFILQFIFIKRIFIYCKNDIEIFIDNIKMPSRIYYQSNKEYYSQYQRKFYNDNKETIKEQARIRYNNLSPEEKQKRNEYAKNRYNNLSED